MSLYVLAIEGGEQAGLHLEFSSAGPYIIGRAQDAHFHLPDGDHRISRYHVILEPVADGVRVRDLQSSNGTFVNGVRVTAALLRPGDSLRVGRSVLILSRTKATTEVLTAAGACSDVGGLRVDGATDTRLSAAPDRCTWKCAVCGLEECQPVAAERFIGADWLCEACATTRRALGVDDTPALGSFDLLRLIGHGATSTVYEARHRETGVRVALKRLRPAAAAIERPMIRRFLKEQRIAISLVHPRIVRCYEGGQDERCHDLYLAMEWLRDGDASRLCAPDSDMQQALLLGADLFEALAYIHALGLVHRDVKPENLLLAAGEHGRFRGKLSDFGIIKNFRAQSQSTQENESCGTPMFMAPEQIYAFRHSGPQVDIYAGAVTLYYMLTRVSPLVLPRDVDPTLSEVFLASWNSKRISLADRRPDAPRPLVEWIDRAVASDATARMEMAAGEIADRLRRLA